MELITLQRIFKQWKKSIKRKLSPRVFKVKLKNSAAGGFYLINPPFNLETQIYWNGFNNYDWERITRKVWQELAISSKVIFDIGANTGIYSLIAKAINPEAHVIAFEPQPNVFSVLKQNQEKNKFDMTCEQIALSDRNGEASFYNYGYDPFGSENTTAGSLNQSWRPNNQKEIKVKTMQLDDYIDNNKVAEVDLIKIDVETFEPQVMKGYSKHIQQHRPIFIMEIQSESIGIEINMMLNSFDYTFYNIDETLGLKQVDKLGLMRDNNYLLCPNDKIDRIKKLLSE